MTMSNSGLAIEPAKEGNAKKPAVRISKKQVNKIGAASL